MSLQPFFEWMNETPISHAIKENIYIYPLDQAVHLVALAVFFGALLVVDLRLIGRGFSSTPIAKVFRDAQPWFLGSFLVLFVTGVPQLMSNPIKNYYSPYFWWKMEVLAITLIFTYTIRRKIALADEGKVGTMWPKIVGLVSIVLWFTIATLSRFIGLLS